MRDVLPNRIASSKSTQQLHARLKRESSTQKRTCDVRGTQLPQTLPFASEKEQLLQASDADDFTEEETTWLRTTSSSKVRNRFTEKNAAS